MDGPGTRHYSTANSAGIDQIPIYLVIARRRPHSQDAILAVQDDLPVGREEIRDEGRQPDPEVYISAVRKILRGAPGDLATFQRHRVPPVTRELRRGGRRRCRA